MICNVMYVTKQQIMLINTNNSCVRFIKIVKKKSEFYYTRGQRILSIITSAKWERPSSELPHNRSSKAKKYTSSFDEPQIEVTMNIKFQMKERKTTQHNATPFIFK